MTNNYTETMAKKTKKAKKPPKKRSPVKKKPKKAKATRRQLPSVVAIVTSDSAVTQAGTGKASLIGIFDRFTVTETDKPVRPFVFFQKLVGGKGKYSLSFEIRDTRGNVVLAGEQSEIECASDQVLTGLTMVQGLVLKESGVYKLQLLADNKPLGIPAPLVVTIQETVDGN